MNIIDIFAADKDYVYMPKIQERRKFILDSIVKQGFVKVSTLAERFGVTQTTIRKDLTFLENEGYLYRAYGSALPAAAPLKDISLNKKILINMDRKVKIAKAAQSLIEENDSIIIASGSTMALFAETIKPKGRLNVVSSSVNISTELGEIEGITVMQIGGILFSNTMSVIGNDAIEAVRNVFCSKLFFGVDGMDIEQGVTCGTIEEADLTRQMMKSSKKKIILSDSSKLGQLGFARICGFDEIDYLITDRDFPEEARTRLEGLGVKVIIAQ